jgi:excinuclease ABC subunit C
MRKCRSSCQRFRDRWADLRSRPYGREISCARAHVCESVFFSRIGMIDTSEEIFMFNVEEELKKLPRKPGVYIMRDDKDVILYVGKAINLHNRVRSYFRENIGRGPAIDQMVSLIARFEYIVTDSELEALVLENNLIKENSPKYNTLLKDDKTYPYIKVTVGEDYPRILFSRTMKKDKSRYFGPYTSAAAVKDTIELLNKLYQLRTCNRVLPRDIGIERPCLNYHIRQCLAPCQGYVSKEEYRQQVAGALEFLNGNYSPILKDLEEKMKKAAEAMEFEDAARYRDLLSSVRQVSQKQKITEGVGEDKDILALYQDETEAVVQVFFVRDGKLIGREHYYMTHVPENNKPAILQDFVKQFYAGTPFIPRELMLQYEIEDAELIEKWLSERKGSRVYLKVPKIGSKEKLVELAAQNAKLVLSQDREKLKREEGRTIGAVKEISDLLQLPLTGTARMEAYDISNINGFENVGSMVVYEKGKPKRSDYRKFKIKSVSGPDDYACMREVLTRRFRHGMEESRELEEQEMDQEYGSFTKFPDLILMDGGRGQVNIALSVLEELGIDIPVCGMVKDDNHRTRGLYYHNIELPIDTHSEGFKLITRIQDEAHRFAIEYHRSLRSKTQVRSVLDDIPGVGPARRKALMRHFKSLEEIRQATVEDLMEIPEMNERTAQEIVAFFASQKRPPVVQS